MTDLTPRIEKLVGRLSRGRAGNARRASGPPPELRPGDPGFGEAVDRLVAMPLDRYGRAGAPLEIRVPWSLESLWFVPVEPDAELLGRDGVSRGRVWTATELIALLALPERTAEIVQGLVLAKRAFDGDIVEAAAMTGTP